MRARAPASSANLGPGFDALAVALACYVEVSVEPAERLSVVAKGQGSDLGTGPGHLAARIAAEVVGHDRLAIEVHSDIPVGRGLGSSAALAAATAAAAGASTTEALDIAARLDGHPDNAAASVLGGLVAATQLDGRLLARRLPLDPSIRFVLVIPDRRLPTREARSVLPASVPLLDAAFNLGRMGLLLAGLADHRLLVAEAGDDRLHQDARAALFPQAPAIVKALREAGALTSCWSGAGPSLLAIGHEGSAGALVAAAGSILKQHEIAGEVRLLSADGTGITVFGGTTH